MRAEYDMAGTVVEHVVTRKGITVDEHGNVTFDAIVKQNENASKIVYLQHRELVPKILKDAMEGEEDEEEVQKEIEETMMPTKVELEKIVNRRLSVA
ncbi:hypothetical protein Vadar_031557 [Vaccinium darrowii]|uniref:Uncharacterized protein n=1 Tax=Vaccinium darrowii TaxID=229202 RepID=A0ACB7XDJ1_9ERIC|nr:hypothetical protein Vadar_031557 [Vaccinium darrowii]